LGFKRATQAATTKSGNAREKLALRQAILHQARMDVDRARERDAVERQLLIMNAIGREPGEQRAEQCDEADDETQPDHSINSASERLAKNTEHLNAVRPAICRKRVRPHRRV
jgi:hypothetical protein